MQVVVKVNGRNVEEMSAREKAEMKKRDEARLAEMFAAGSPPRAVTDDTRFAGFTETGGAQFKSPELRDFYLNAAKEAGISVSGKQYIGAIAEYPGDPRAWVSSQGEIRAYAEEKGMTLSGDITVKGLQAEPGPDVKLAPDIVDDLVEGRLAEKYGDDLDGVKVPVREYHDTRESVIQDHGTPAHLGG